MAGIHAEKSIIYFSGNAKRRNGEGMNERVLVIQAARFGDLVQTGRLIAAAGQGGREVHLAVDESLASLARILYPETVVHGIGFHGKCDSAEGAASRVGELRQLDFAAVYNCNFSPITAALCRAFKSGRVIGYRPAHNSAGGLLRSAWCRMAFRLGSRRYATPLNLVDFWGYFHDMPPPLTNPPARGGSRGIGIAVAGRAARRSLPVEALAQAARIAFKIKEPTAIRIFGTTAEAPAARKLMRLFSPTMLEKTTDLCGKTDWKSLCDEITGLDLMLAPDTGLMHLAARLGVPVLAFFLSSAWCHETGPYGAGHAILQAAPACAPCIESAPCPHAGTCGKPFESAQFGRAVASALTGCAPQADWPENLQLWRTDCDRFGALLHLEAGADKWVQAREQNRAFLENYLGLCSMPDTGGMTRELLPASEWMLPPGRYC